MLKFLLILIYLHAQIGRSKSHHMVIFLPVGNGHVGCSFFLFLFFLITVTYYDFPWFVIHKGVLEKIKNKNKERETSGGIYDCPPHLTLTINYDKIYVESSKKISGR